MSPAWALPRPVGVNKKGLSHGLKMQDGPNTIAPGSVTVNNPDSSTNAAIAWLEPNSTAVFSFRGTVSKEDWLKDFQLWCAPHRVRSCTHKGACTGLFAAAIDSCMLEHAMLIMTCHLASFWQFLCGRATACCNLHAPSLPL